MSCLKRCLKVEDGTVVADAIDNAWEFVVEQANEFLKREAAKQGIDAPDVTDKLYRVGVKKHLAPMRDKDVMHYATKVNAARE